MTDAELDELQHSEEASCSGSSDQDAGQQGAASGRSPRESLDLDLSLGGGAKGTGPRLFCGHVPKEVNDEMVRQHFSKWGTVSDVYFPRHKKTLKRRPFCFVTFANKEDAERALAESGLEIAGVAIKNLTMVEDRDKYYTNKHATARQALLQALKQLGPSTQQQPAASASSAAAMAPPAPPAGALGSSSSGLGPMSAEQLSSLAAVLALEGVPTDVILQTLGLPATLAEALLPPASAPMSLAGLGGLDGAALLAQALPSPALSSQTGFDLAAAVAARGSLDLRASFDLSSASLPLVPSARTSMDLGSLHQSLAAAAAAMHPSDSRSTLATCDWSNAPSARTSMDVGGLPLLPPASAGFMAPAPALSRLSLDAALALQQRQQMQQTQQLLASQGRLSAAYPTPQQPLASVMHSGFYQPAAAAAPPPPRQPEPQLSMQSVLSSGLYGGGAPAGAPLPPPPARHSIALGEYGSGGGLVPFGDTWTPAPREQQGTLGGYSTALRPSIDRGGLPPLPPRSPNQDAAPRHPGSGSPDAMLGLAGRWPMSGQRVMA